MIGNTFYHAFLVEVKSCGRAEGAGTACVFEFMGHILNALCHCEEWGSFLGASLFSLNTCLGFTATAISRLRMLRGLSWERCHSPLETTGILAVFHVHVYLIYNTHV